MSREIFQETPRPESKVHFIIEAEIDSRTCPAELIILPKLPAEPGQDPQVTEILFFYPQTPEQAVACSRQLVENGFLGRVRREVDSRFGSNKDFAQRTLLDGFLYKYSGIVWRREPWVFGNWFLREGVPWEKNGQFSLSFSLSRRPGHLVSRRELMEYMSCSPQGRAESFMRALEEYSSGIIRRTEIIPHG